MSDTNPSQPLSDGDKAIMWTVGIVAGLMVLGLIGAANQAHNSASPSTPTTYESTEDKLRRVYDSQGIQYDNQMIREDAKAIEQLHREFGNN